MIQGSQIFPDRNIDSSGQAGDDKRWAGRALSIERCSPSAMIQWAKLPSAPLLSISLSTVASSVAGSRTWSYITGSVSEAILSSVAVTVDGSLVRGGLWLSVSGGSGFGSMQQGDGELGSGSGVGHSPQCPL